MTDPVGGNYRHDICSRMPLHTSLPVRFGIRLKNRLTADRSRVKQDLRPQKRHTSGSFRKPLIPADAHTNGCILRFPDLKPGITRSKEKLLRIRHPIRNMGLSVFSKNRTIRINNGNRIKRRISCPLKKAHRDHHVQLFCHLLKTLHSRILLQRCGKVHIFKIMPLTKIRCLKKLLQKNDIRTLRSRLPHQFFRFCKRCFSVPCAAHLCSRYYNFPHRSSSPFCFFIRSGNPSLYCLSTVISTVSPFLQSLTYYS